MRRANKAAFTSRRYRELMQNNRFECYKHLDTNPSEDVAICPHHHAFYEIIFVVEGDFFYEVEGRPYHLSHGDVILIDELQFHHGLIYHTKGYERYALWIHPKYMQRLARRFPKLDPQYCFLQLNSDNNNIIHLDDTTFSELQQDLSCLFESFWSKTPSDEVLSESYFAIILTKLNQIVHRQHSAQEIPVISATSSHVSTVSSSLDSDAFAGMYNQPRYSNMPPITHSAQALQEAINLKAAVADSSVSGGSLQGMQAGSTGLVMPDGSPLRTTLSTRPDLSNTNCSTSTVLTSGTEGYGTGMEPGSDVGNYGYSSISSVGVHLTNIGSGVNSENRAGTCSAVASAAAGSNATDGFVAGNAASGADAESARASCGQPGDGQPGGDIAGGGTAGASGPARQAAARGAVAAELEHHEGSEPPRPDFMAIQSMDDMLAVVNAQHHLHPEQVGYLNGMPLQYATGNTSDGIEHVFDQGREILPDSIAGSGRNESVTPFGFNSSLCSQRPCFAQSGGLNEALLSTLYTGSSLVSFAPSFREGASAEDVSFFDPDPELDVPLVSDGAGNPGDADEIAALESLQAGSRAGPLPGCSQGKNVISNCPGAAAARAAMSSQVTSDDGSITGVDSASSLAAANSRLKTRGRSRSPVPGAGAAGAHGAGKPGAAGTGRPGHTDMAAMAAAMGAETSPGASVTAGDEEAINAAAAAAAAVAASAKPAQESGSSGGRRRSDSYATDGSVSVPGADKDSGRERNGHDFQTLIMQGEGLTPAPVVGDGETADFEIPGDDDEMHLNLKLSESLKLSALLKFINLNINENLSLDEISQRFNLSKFYLTRRFKELTGLSLHQFIVKKRLTRARYLISVGMDPYRAAVEAGFNNYSHFSRTFKSYFGQNPSTIPQAKNIHVKSATAATDTPVPSRVDQDIRIRD